MSRKTIKKYLALLTALLAIAFLILAYQRNWIRPDADVVQTDKGHLQGQVLGSSCSVVVTLGTQTATVSNSNSRFLIKNIIPGKYPLSAKDCSDENRTFGTIAIEKNKISSKALDWSQGLGQNIFGTGGKIDAVAQSEGIYLPVPRPKAKVEQYDALGNLAVILTWEVTVAENYDNEIGYIINKDGQDIAYYNPNETEYIEDNEEEVNASTGGLFVDTAITPGETHRYAVASFDRSGQTTPFIAVIIKIEAGAQGQ